MRAIRESGGARAAVLEQWRDGYLCEKKRGRTCAQRRCEKNVIFRFGPGGWLGTRVTHAQTARTGAGGAQKNIKK